MIEGLVIHERGLVVVVGVGHDGWGVDLFLL